MQKCAKAYLQLSCLKEQVHPKEPLHPREYLAFVLYFVSLPRQMFLTELKLVLDLANRLVGKKVINFPRLLLL